MSELQNIPPVLSLPSPARTLRKLFLTLFLRGRSSRGLRKESAPKSVGSKLALTIAFYILIGGFMALAFIRQPLFSLSVYLHASTFVFLGMFIAASAGEILFNKEEADILLHRPVSARALLWAKVGVLVEVSLWLAGAFNLFGFVIGVFVADGNALFPIAHVISTVLEALFCTGSVVLAYQLCLRWFGRERLEAVMTTTQVLVAVAAVFGGQIIPRLLGRFGDQFARFVESWWAKLLPPVWFAGLDEAIAGGRGLNSLLLAAIAIVATGTVLWLAFGKLARDYEIGLQLLGETSRKRPLKTGRRRWLSVLVDKPPLRWWLRDPVARASFLLTAAYLFRDREVKLRIYPSLAPILVMPIILLMPAGGRGGFQQSGFGVAFTGAYLGLVPMLALGLLRYSQQWQAADLFRVAPLHGPGALWHGSRRAVLFFITGPTVAAFAGIFCLLGARFSNLFLILPGVLALPIYAIAPCVLGRAVPFSVPPEEGKSAGRGLSVLGVMLVSMALSGLGLWTWSAGIFWWMIAIEAAAVAVLYVALRIALDKLSWRPIE